MKTNWTTKEEYLQFVRDWKRIYKALSAMIRETRLDRRIGASLSASKEESRRWPKETRETLDIRRAARSKALEVIHKEVGHSFWDLSSFATELLVIRKEEKVRAGEARALRLAQPAEAKL